MSWIRQAIFSVNFSVITSFLHWYLTVPGANFNNSLGSIVKSFYGVNQNSCITAYYMFFYNFLCKQLFCIGSISLIFLLGKRAALEQGKNVNSLIIYLSNSLSSACNLNNMKIVLSYTLCHSYFWSFEWLFLFYSSKQPRVQFTLWSYDAERGIAEGSEKKIIKNNSLRYIENVAFNNYHYKYSQVKMNL